MPKRTITEELVQEQQSRAIEFQKFRAEFLFTQKRLAEILGLSRRTVQMIEAGKITPHAGTLRSFQTLRTKYEAERG